ncbi:DUF4232 domain-containing protein [Streptomyces sp. NPDC017936]|uniref:DUF4232 domain-containing protein n=1 Tax=Streptomyces sp. NPDC017936 TaxID=3365016 RepID=UPI0037A4C45C
MRAVPITVTALLSALLLTACSSDDGGSGDEGNKASGSACAVGGLGRQIEANAAPAAGDSGNVTVTLTNEGADECTLEGLPAVDLHAGDTSVPLQPDAAAEARKLTLPAQGTTSFTITYARGGSGGESLAVETVTYSLPGSTKTESFPWSYGDVALKGEGEPDASVSTFQQAGD